jgi:hypothetical protein
MPIWMMAMTSRFRSSGLVPSQQASRMASATHWAYACA